MPWSGGAGWLSRLGTALRPPTTERTAAAMRSDLSGSGDKSQDGEVAQKRKGILKGSKSSMLSESQTSAPTRVVEEDLLLCASKVVQGNSEEGREEVATVRQRIAPQSSVNLKFDVVGNAEDDEEEDEKKKVAPAEESAHYLCWCVRATSGGDVWLAIYRRPLLRRVVNTDRVSRYTIGDSRHSSPGAKTPPEADGRGRDAPSPPGKSSGAEEDPDSIQVAEEKEATRPEETNGSRHVNSSVNNSASKQSGNVISVFEEVEEDDGTSEDLNFELEVVEPPRCVPRSRKDFIRGRTRCQPGFTYTVALDNASAVFPSKTVDYCIRLVVGDRKDEKSDESDGKAASTAAMTTAAMDDLSGDIPAKLEDLVRFVGEITSSDSRNSIRPENSSSSSKQKSSGKESSKGKSKPLATSPGQNQSKGQTPKPKSDVKKCDQTSADKGEKLDAASEDAARTSNVRDDEKVEEKSAGGQLSPKSPSADN